MANFKKSIEKLSQKLNEMTYKESNEYMEIILLSYEMQLNKFDQLTAFNQSLNNPSTKVMTKKRANHEDKYLSMRKRSKAFSLFSNNVNLIKELQSKGRSYQEIATYLNMHRANATKEVSFTKQTVYKYINKLKELHKWSK